MLNNLKSWININTPSLNQFLYPSTHAHIVITIDYETWQPIPKGKNIDWDKDIFNPTEDWLLIAEKYNIPLSFFVDIAEIYWLRKNMPQIAEKMELQIQKISKQNHDIQLHIHPTWLPELNNVSYKNGIWYGLEKNIRLQNCSKQLPELIKQWKNDLEEIAQKGNPNCKVRAFRAAKYQIQPSKEIIESLVAAGIEADSSVWKGGYDSTHEFDFRNAYNEHTPYFANTYNPSYLSPIGETGILEIPISSFNNNRWCLDNINAQEALYQMLTHYWSKNSNISSTALIYTAIAHTKHIQDKDIILKILKSLPSVSFKKINDIITYYSPTTIKSTREQAYQKHIQTQIDYDSHAILGDERNWQQSFYVQDKIPLDRKKILDLGCGSGYWTDRLNKNLGETIGIDIGESFIKKAKKQYPTLQFQVMDFHHLKFNDNYFDCVYADNTMEHSPFPNKLIEEIYRILSKNGLLVALIPPDARNSKESGPDHVWKTDKDDIQQRLEEGGFTSIFIEEINIIKLGMKPYPPSNNIMFHIQAWKKYSKEERVKDLTKFCYKKLKPLPHISQDGLSILKGGKALCAGYVAALETLLHRENFKTRWWSLQAKNMPNGKGENKIDSHEILEVEINKKWNIVDPTIGIVFPWSLQEIYQNTQQLDNFIETIHQDKRWKERSYKDYASSTFYKNIIQFQKREKNFSPFVKVNKTHLFIAH